MPRATPRVDAMVAAEARSRRGVGEAYDQVAKGKRDYYYYCRPRRRRRRRRRRSR
jgi:hypothetical protein